MRSSRASHCRGRTLKPAQHWDGRRDSLQPGPALRFMGVRRARRRSTTRQGSRRGKPGEFHRACMRYVVQVLELGCSVGAC